MAMCIHLQWKICTFSGIPKTFIENQASLLPSCENFNSASTCCALPFLGPLLWTTILNLGA